MRDATNVPLPSDDVHALARGAGIALPGQVLGRILIFVCHVILARLLGSQAFGLYAIGWTILKVAGMVAVLGMPIGVVRLGAQEWKRDAPRFRGVVLQALGSALAAGMLLGLALHLAAPWLAERVFHNPGLTQVMRLFAPAIALSAGLEVASSATRITRKVEFAILARDILQPGLYVAFAVCALLLGTGLAGVIVSAVASYALSLIVVLVFLASLFPELTAVRAGVAAVLGEMLGPSVVYTLAAIFLAVMMWVDRLIVGAFRPAAEVGVYQAVSQASTLFSVILGALALIFGPMVARLHVEQDRSRLLELYRVTTKWTLAISLPILLVVVLAPDDIVRLLYGADYSDGAWPLLVLTVGQVLNAASGPTAVFLNMTGNHRMLMHIAGLGLLANCVFGVLLVPGLGILGAALSTAASLAGYSLACLLAVRWTLAAWPYDQRMLKLSGVTLATAAVLALVMQALPLEGTPRLAVLSTSSVLVFAAIAMSLRLDDEDRAFLALLRSMLIGRAR